MEIASNFAMISAKFYCPQQLSKAVTRSTPRLNAGMTHQPARRRFRARGCNATGLTRVHLLFTWTWLAAADRRRLGAGITRDGVLSAG